MRTVNVGTYIGWVEQRSRDVWMFEDALRDSSRHSLDLMPGDLMLQHQTSNQDVTVLWSKIVHTATSRLNSHEYNTKIMNKGLFINIWRDLKKKGRITKRNKAFIHRILLERKKRQPNAFSHQHTPSPIRYCTQAIRTKTSRMYMR